jgi:type I pantothenate kinase
MSDLASLVAAALGSPPPHVVGVGGAVAVGKSTIARELASDFAARGRRVDVVATDAFLFPNAVLAERELTYRKGFPETYDWDAVAAFVDAVKSGTGSVEVPVYSHTIYDIVPEQTTVINEADLVVLEGVTALQSRVAGKLDAAIYIDADESDVKRWFVDRFVTLVDEARSGAESFYRIFAAMSDDEVRHVASDTWEGINGPNLHEHIEPTRANASIVVVKGPGHEIVSVRALR